MSNPIYSATIRLRFDRARSAVRIAATEPVRRMLISRPLRWLTVARGSRSQRQATNTLKLENRMLRIGIPIFLGNLLSAVLLAQTPRPHVVSDAYRAEFELNAERIIAAADDMPAERYAFRPTPAQLSFSEVVIHVLEGNDNIGAVVGDTAMPQHSPVTAADPKTVLVARLKATFAFCRVALARLDDSRLSDPLVEYGDRAHALFSTINHWSDHYSQMAIYLRLNGVLPPTARGKTAAPASGTSDSIRQTDRGCVPQAPGAMPVHHHNGAPIQSSGRSNPVGINQVNPTDCSK